MSWHSELWIRRQPVGNYLSRQLRVLMQNTSRRKARDYETHGKFDTRRAYALPLGRFDVFKQPPRITDDRMACSLVIDQSGSMDGGRARNALDCAYVFSSALSRLRVPFEIIGFASGSGWGSGVTISIFKKFTQAMTARQAEIMSGVASSTGGTYAAEGMAVAWTRLLMRPEPKKIMFVLTDGGVSNNTAEAAKAIQKRGAMVIGVGVGVTLPEHLFDLSVSVVNAGELPAAFMELVRSSLVKGASNHGR